MVLIKPPEIISGEGLAYLGAWSRGGACERLAEF